MERYTVEKFPFTIEHEIEIEMPPGEVIRIEVQGEKAFLWAICYATSLRVMRKFVLVETGQLLPKNTCGSGMGN